MSALSLSLISAIVVSLISFIGILTLAVKEKFLNKILIYLVSFSAGGLMGGAFFHLLPEAVEDEKKTLNIFLFAIFGFCLFFILERFLRWHHCHDDKCDRRKHLGYMNLVGDGVHNIIDGIIIYSSFIINPALGIAVTLSIIFHEIPQEIGDFGVLLYSGMKKNKAIFFNFISGLLAVLGVLIGYVLIAWLHDITHILISLASGGFIYIAATDLIPELHKEIKTKKSILTFIVFILALVLMYVLKVVAE